MSTRRSTSRALASLHQMTCLDTGGPQLIQPLLQSMHQLIGFESGGYFYPGGDGELEAHMEDPGVAAAVPEHFDPCLLRSESQMFHNTLRQSSDIALHEYGPRTLGQMLRGTYSGLLRSDYYNVVMRPAGVADWLCLALRTQQGQGIGMLFLFRPAGAQPFQQAEVATLARLESHLARALQPGASDADERDAHRQGLLIATLDAKPLWICPEAEVLMPLAFGWRWRRGAELPAVVKALLQRLVPRPGTLPPPPHMDWCNAQGRFSLRAVRLAAALGHGEAVGVHITQHVARGVRLMSALNALRLPQRQYELAYWLARGLSESQIAQRMDISLNTVVYHRRQLYNRLGASNRIELLTQLGLYGRP